MICYILTSFLVIYLVTRPRRAPKPTKNVGTQTEQGVLVDQGTQTLLTDAMHVSSDGDSESDPFLFDIDVDFY